ncbi:hypothetical protein UlMin_012329 [Ulmus minor]
MSRQYIPLKDITIGTKGWTAKVIVEAKGMPRSSQCSPVKYQRMILRDSAGTKVQATIFESDIDKFSDVLTLYRTYYISNAVVKTILPQHRIANNDFQWHINSKTVVEEVTEEYSSISVLPHNFVPFSEFSKYMNSDVYVDVIGVVIDAHLTREIPTVNGPQKIQELLLVDQQLIPKIFTMWDQFIDNECAAIVKNIKTKPIIAAYRIRIVSFNGGSMSTKGSSTFVINPDIPEATRLKSWCVDNKAELEQLTLKKSYVGSSSSAIRAPAPHEIIEVKDIQCLEEKQTTFWLQAKISIPHLNQKYWYMACNKCYRRTNIDYKQTFDCVHCAEKQARAMPRCLLEVQLSDKTGALIATLFGENAEKFICCSAETLMQNSTEKHPLQLSSMWQLNLLINFLMQLIQIFKRQIQWRYSPTTEMKTAKLSTLIINSKMKCNSL